MAKKMGKGKHATKREKKTIEKTIVVSLYPGRKKRRTLAHAERENTKMAEAMSKELSQKDSYTTFHKRVYYKFRSRGFHSQVQEATQRRVFATKVTNTKQHFTVLPTEYNFPRSAKLMYSHRGNPLLLVSPYKQRIAIPIVKDGGYRRLAMHITEGWQPKSCILYRVKGRWHAHIVVSIPTPPAYTPGGVVGVDLGGVILASVTLNHPSFPLVESYEGKDILYHLERYTRRRAQLQQLRDTTPRIVLAQRANKTLKNLWAKEKHFVHTRCEQATHHIVNLAYSTRSAVVGEELKGLRKKFTKRHIHGFKGAKTLRRRLNRWIFRYFLAFLERVYALHGIPFTTVPPHHTSQLCSRCGRTTKRARVTRGLYLCPHCSFEVNADRNASRNISYRGFISFGLPLFTAWFSYYQQTLQTFPCERKTRFFQCPRLGAIAPPPS